MKIYKKNLQYAQDFQKRHYNKAIKSRSYTRNDKVWLNTKYIKTKQNQKLKAKFFRLFCILHSVGKQAYKMKLPKKWRIHNIFHVLLLEKNVTKKGRVDIQLELKKSNSQKYEVKIIWDNVVYTRELKSHLSSLYYLIFQKSYPKEKNT